MIYLLDSNILLYAKMDAMPEHKTISAWLIAALTNKDMTVALCETSILSFLRVSTNPKVFHPPLPLKEALSFIKSLVFHANVHISRTSPKHYIELIKFMKQHDFTGNLAMDAHLAVLALNTGAVLVTRDSDFKKISYLKTYNPMTK
jgi:uncharacterized protein